MSFFLTTAAASFRRGGGDLSEYLINILSPNEGEEVAADFTATFEINGITSINMTNITEGQEVESDFTINIELN